MAVGFAQDKTTFQTRRQLENERIKHPLKPKVSRRKLVAAFLSKITFREKIVRNKKKVLVVSLGVFLVAGSGVAYGVYEYNLQNNPAVIYHKKVESIMGQVSKYTSLPANEQPVFATVTDTHVLPKSAFFQQAQDGDKIIMYKKHKLAILFRPITGQVITKATLIFRDVTPTPQSDSVAGASTSAASEQHVVSSPIPHKSVSLQPEQSSYHPQGKILVSPQ